MLEGDLGGGLDIAQQPPTQLQHQVSINKQQFNLKTTNTTILNGASSQTQYTNNLTNSPNRTGATINTNNYQIASQQQQQQQQQQINKLNSNNSNFNPNPTSNLNNQFQKIAVLKSGAGATTTSNPAAQGVQQPQTPMNTTFHNVGNVNINNINITVQPNAQQQQQQQQQLLNRYVELSLFLS